MCSHLLVCADPAQKSRCLQDASTSHGEVGPCPMQCLLCTACPACDVALMNALLCVHGARACIVLLLLVCSCKSSLTTLAGLHVAMLFEWCGQTLPSGHVGPPATAGNKRWLGNTLTCSHGRFGCTHFGRDVGHPTDQTYFLCGWRETDWTGRPARPIGCDPREPYTPSLAAATRPVLSFSVSHLPSWLYPSHGRDWPPNPSDLGDCLGLPPRAPFPGPPLGGCSIRRVSSIPLTPRGEPDWQSGQGW